jgi:hypothetical protein
LSVTVVVSGGSGNPVPTGTVTLSGGGYSSAATTLSGGSASIMSETTHMASQFKDEKTGETKFQDVAKVLFSGETETKNISLNRATINGLVDAYGEESADWQNHVLTCETEKMRVGGRAVTAVYLVPENYERVDDENGYTVIVKSGTKVGAPEELPSVDF